MKRLEDIKNEYALELSEVYKRTFTNWNEMLDTDFERGTGVSKVYDIEQLMDEVAKRYAREVAQASLQKAADNLVQAPFSFNSDFNSQKIAIRSPKNITLL
ncbi:hypothetical protein CMU30_13905 [Elizabethkingia anophelis]|nr:hypothetical protein [Elizabethkingia anophelis]MDV3684373.1 hypothetical protein [Elizabethkingia anophelis]MDV3699716.1 hypothetical protein [Elizabethkingia anophelis]MDV3763631.1 hypothetical protein [Elizabethkingia anophelis]MDV3802634.1 hypothetical protein [Elizabethkingia anophelis]